MKVEDDKDDCSNQKPCTSSLEADLQKPNVCSDYFESNTIGLPFAGTLSITAGNDLLISNQSVDECVRETHVDVEQVGTVSDLSVPFISPDNSINDYLPENLKILIEGQKYGLLKTQRIDIPDWFDPYKFKAGQEFAMKYYFGVNFAEMLSLLILFSFEDSFKALMFTDKSSTPIASFKRYLSTVLRVKTWYEQDVFDSDTCAHNNIKIVQAMHSYISKQMNESSTGQVDARIEDLNGSKRLVCPSRDYIKDDFGASLCPFIDRHSYQNPGSNCELFFNQFSMSTTQFGFLGLIILYPDKFGAANATDRELEGFVHLWRVLGRLLGVDDRYNFCNGDLDQVKTRCRDLLTYWAIPNFTNISAEWEHFSRCLVKGVNFYVPANSFDVSILYLCFVLGINARKFYVKVPWSNYLKYLLFKFVLCCALRFPCILNLANKALISSLMNAKNYSDERLLRIERDSNEFMGLC